MISESQERMVAVVAPDRVDEVQQVCERWELPCTVIGEVNYYVSCAKVFDDDVVGSIPAAPLTDECATMFRSAPRPVEPAPVAPVNDEPKTWVFEQRPPRRLAHDPAARARRRRAANRRNARHRTVRRAAALAAAYRSKPAGARCWTPR